MINRTQFLLIIDFDCETLEQFSRNNFSLEILIETMILYNSNINSIAKCFQRTPLHTAIVHSNQLASVFLQYFGNHWIFLQQSR